MFKRILKLMREKIRALEYVMTIHAEEEMNDDSLSIYDVEQAFLTGNIEERQQDLASGERKYRIRGKTVDSMPMEVIAKLSPTGKLVIITVYLLTQDGNQNDM